MRGTRGLAALIVVAIVAISSCTLQTATAPGGKLTLIAEFDDSQGLTVGHNVQVANVVVGSVRHIELDGYRSRVTMSIVDNRPIPVGTSAVLKRTSLLGEHFVELVFPASFDTDKGPFLKDNAEIAETDEQPDFEQLAEQAADVVGAITGDDIAAIVDAGAVGIGGRGATLHQVIGQLATVTGALASQRESLAAAVDGLGQLGSDLGTGADQVGDLIDDLASTSQILADNRDRLVATLGELVRLARVANDAVLGPHAERLRELVERADPILAAIVEKRATLEDLIPSLRSFTEKITQAVRNDSLLVFVWLFLPEAAMVPTRAAISDPVVNLVNLVAPR